ncbi:MAG: RNA polymerase sigma factor [Clostridia bacterium]|nr:RNA polymerase sigma factor [Clostridia bacterium]
MLFLMTVYENLQEEKSETLDELLLMISKGDQDSFREFYEKTKTAVYGFALSLIKNTYDAEDIMQSTYVNVYHAAINYQKQGKPMAWVLTITKNLCLEKMRKLKREAVLPEFSDYSVKFSEEMNVDDKLLIEFYLNSLKLNERKIVVLHIVAGLKHREIADLLNIPLGTVLATYQRAIRKTKKYLQGGEYGDE